MEKSVAAKFKRNSYRQKCSQNVSINFTNMCHDYHRNEYFAPTSSASAHSHLSESIIILMDLPFTQHQRSPASATTQINSAITQTQSQLPHPSLPSQAHTFVPKRKSSTDPTGHYHYKRRRPGLESSSGYPVCAIERSPSAFNNYMLFGRTGSWGAHELKQSNE